MNTGKPGTGKRKSSSKENLKFNTPVSFNLGLAIEFSTKQNQQHETKQKRRTDNNKTEKDKRRVVSITTKSSIPIIVKRKPIVIVKQDIHIDNHQLSAEPETDVNGDFYQKKPKSTTLKRKIKEFSNVSGASSYDELPNTSIQSEEKGHQSNPVIQIDELFIPDTNTILREAITAYIKGVSKVSKNLYSRDIDKAKQRRFIITGLHETIHYAKFNKAQFICIAEDVIDMGETRQMIKTIVDFCESNNIMVVQCFKRRKLARLFGRGQSMSCICILKDSFTVISELKLLQDAFSSFSKNSSE